MDGLAMLKDTSQPIHQSTISPLANGYPNLFLRVGMGRAKVAGAQYFEVGALVYFIGRLGYPLEHNVSEGGRKVGSWPFVQKYRV